MIIRKCLTHFDTTNFTNHNLIHGIKVCFYNIRCGILFEILRIRRETFPDSELLLESLRNKISHFSFGSFVAKCDCQKSCDFSFFKMYILFLLGQALEIFSKKSMATLYLSILQSSK